MPAPVWPTVTLLAADDVAPGCVYLLCTSLPLCFCLVVGRVHGQCSEEEIRELEAAAIQRQLEDQRLQLEAEKRERAKEERKARLTGGAETIQEARKRKADVKRLKMLVLTGSVEDASRAMKDMRGGKERR